MRLAPLGEAAQAFGGVLAAHNAGQQRGDSVAPGVWAAAETGTRAGQCGLYAQRSLPGDMTTGLGTGSRHTPNGSNRVEPYRTCGPCSATAGQVDHESH